MTTADLNKTIFARLSDKLCYAMALAFLQTPLKRFGFRTPSITRFDSTDNWEADRVADVSAYRKLFTRFAQFEGKRVLDLGCNKGYLLNSFLQHEKFTAIGADIVTSYLDYGRATYPNVTFIQTTPSSIPLESETIDLVYTIDTVEHLSRPREIFSEVFRVLKPGGQFLVHFNPWLNPYGSHMEDIIPFPWPHVVFSMDTLLTTAAKVYESPAYPTACYFIDNGKKVSNPFLDRDKWAEYLNKMTITRFNRLLKTLPFALQHQERIGFGGKTFKFSKAVKGLSQVRLLDEFFTNALFTVLVKPSHW